MTLLSATYSVVACLLVLAVLVLPALMHRSSRRLAEEAAHLFRAARQDDPIDPDLDVVAAIKEARRRYFSAQRSLPGSS